MLGPVSGATVTAYSIDPSTGSLNLHEVLGSATTSSDGTYTLILNRAPTGAIGVRMTGGSYTEEGNGSLISLGQNSFTSLVPLASLGQVTNAAIGPLPEIAFQRFSSQIESGVPAGKTIEQLVVDANSSVSVAFGISDVVGVLPSNTFGTIENDSSGQYALVLAALSKSASNVGVDSIALSHAYSENFKSTGSFSPYAVTVSQGDGTVVTVTPPTLTVLSSVATHISNGTTVLNGVHPPSGAGAVQCPPMNPSAPGPTSPEYGPPPPPLVPPPPTPPPAPPRAPASPSVPTPPPTPPPHA